MFVYQARAAWAHAFAASALFIVGLLTTMAAGLYPSLLPSHEGKPFSLTVHNAASGDTALTTALFWWPVGMLLAALYFVYAYRLFFRGPREPTIETH
jgi:cytochrome d ubiquinol oxidase subunit II